MKNKKPIKGKKANAKHLAARRAQMQHQFKIMRKYPKKLARYEKQFSDADQASTLTEEILDSIEPVPEATEATDLPATS